MKSAKTIALIAGICFFLLAVFIQGIIPYLFREIKTQKVTKVVRTHLGNLQEIKADPLPYDGLAEKGRRIYIRGGCWYCHSMYIRPLQSERKRWGPFSEFGEYSYDLPHLFGTRRIGLDLSR